MKQDTLALLNEIKNPVDYVQFEKWLLPETWDKTHIHDFSRAYAYRGKTISIIRFTLSSCPCLDKFLNFLYQQNLIYPDPQVFRDYYYDDTTLYFSAYVKYDIVISTIPETFGEKYVLQVIEMLFNR